MKKLSIEFYRHEDVLKIARDLLGKIIVTRFRGITTSARIVETEAYAGVADKASHASGGRRTARNEVMYGPGGFSYVYLCYGIHHLFNVVTNMKDVPHAVLIRGAEPLEGMPAMLRRAGRKKVDHSLTRGPGNLTRALGIRTLHNGLSLRSEKIFLAEDGYCPDPGEIICSPRIGVDYAGADAWLPYRFFIAGNPFVSRPPGKKPGLSR